MRLTHLAISIAVGALLSLFYQGMPVSAATKTLDLTKIPPSARRSFGVPGGSGGGIGGRAPVSQLYDLPVTMRIVDLHPIPDSPYITLTIEIANSGESPLEVPTCLDAYAAFVPGARNRRSFNFGVVVEHPGTTERFSEFLEVTSGSDSAPKCLTPLARGNTLLVIMNAKLPKEVPEAAETAISQPLLRAFVEEWKFEDSRYVINRKSNRVESEALQLKQ